VQMPITIKANNIEHKIVFIMQRIGTFEL
jgi:hypothetical protein